MYKLFIVLTLLAPVALLIGLVRPSLFSRILGSESRKRIALVFGIATFAFFITSAVLVPASVRTQWDAEKKARDEQSAQQEAARQAQLAQEAAEKAQPTEQAQPQPAQQQPPTQQPRSIEDRIRAVAVNTGTTDISYRGIEDQKADSDRPAGSRMITVSLNLGDFFTASSFYRDTGKVTSQIFREAFTNPNAYDVIVWYYGDTTDQYGKKENDIILSQAIDKKTFLKIAWDNFDSSKLCDFLKSEGRSNGGQTTCVALANIK